MTTIVAIASDGHPNSTVGLCPPAITLDDKGTYRASKAQGWLWRQWLSYWKEIDRLKTEHNASLFVIFNGDWVEKDAYGGTQVITRNEADILKIAAAAIEPGTNLADLLFFIRGTPVHVGKSGSWEEKLAQDFDHTEPDEFGNYSWSTLLAEFDGVLFDIAHTPRARGLLPWTMQAAANKQSEILFNHYGRRREKIPDVGVRSHVHYAADSGIGSFPRVFYTWGMQLRPSYVQAGGIRNVGALAFICDKGKYTPWVAEYQPLRRKIWTIKSQKTT